MLNKKVICTIKENVKEYEIVTEEEDLSKELNAHDIIVKIHSCGLSTINEKLLQKFIETNENYPVGHEISGTIVKVGSNVKRFNVDDEIAGIIPLDNKYGGCASYCVITEYDIVHKPTKLSHLDAACGIGDALKAYTSLYYKAHIASGETVVVQSAAKGFGIVTIQLAQYLGAKVIAVGSTDEEIVFLKNFDPPVDQVVDLRSTSRRNLTTVCLEETGGIGVDCFIDDGVEMYPEEFRTPSRHQTLLPSKHEIITCLAVGGRWITAQQNLQIDPPDSEMLSLKSASLHYLFEQSWSLSKGAIGRYLHVLNDIMAKMSEGILRPTVHHTVLLDDCIENLANIDNTTIGKIVVKV